MTVTKKAKPVFKKAREVMKAPKKPKPCPFKTREDFKGFAAQFPKEAAFFGKLVVMWRGSRATLEGHTGYWAAYTRAEWAEWMKCSEPTIGRWLNRLEDHGLIERELGKFKGNAVYAFIRPTPEGLQFAGSRPTDLHHLGKKPNTKTLSSPEPKPIAKANIKSSEVEEYDPKPKTLAELQAILDEPAG